MIDITAIDKALHDCFVALDIKARYVVVVHDPVNGVAAIGTNIEEPPAAQGLLVNALYTMAQREPDIQTMVGDDIGETRGRA